MTYRDLKTDLEWRNYLTLLLKNNPKALEKAIILIYKRQTPEEQIKRSTLDHNNIGFGRIDADIMGRIAEDIIHDRELSDRDWAIARNKMPKYWRQLMIISKEKMLDEKTGT